MDPHDEALPSPSVEATAVLLHLNYLRCTALLGQRLAATFPDMSSWNAALGDPLVRESVESLAQILAEVRALSEALDETDLDAIAQFGGQHYARTLETVEGLALTLGLEPDTILTALLYA